MRDYYINGPALVAVKGNSSCGIAALSELGLSDGPIQPQETFHHFDIQVDAWGGYVPPEIQWMGAEMIIPMSLVHFDPDVLDVCLREAKAGSAAAGMMRRAGARMGGGVNRLVAGNHFIGLNITSPDAGRPWRFLTSYLYGTPVQFPLGTERTGVLLNWRAIPYAVDPYGGGTGMEGTLLYDHTLDT